MTTKPVATDNVKATFTTQTTASQSNTLRRLDSEFLFAGAREIEIEFMGMIYKLRKTSQNKLILTK
jgi:hemin uptake protein HemP